MNTFFAVITGASQGLGESFAMELARSGANLILTSLPDQGLPALCERLKRQYGIQAHAYETDLSNTKNVAQFGDWVNARFPIDMLINNVGIGGTQKFVDATDESIERIIQLNVMTPSLLSHQLLPNLLQRTRAYILNVSSLAAFSPIGYKTVYPASKAFVRSFSRGLNEELKDTQVSVSVVYPGPMRTNRDSIQRMERQGALARMASVTPDKVARYCVRRMIRRDSVILLNWPSLLFLALLPAWLKTPLLTRHIKRELAVQK